MKEFKGSKGYWKMNGVSMTGDAHFNVIGTELGGKFKIARVPWVDGNKETMVEAEANAKLIAAAPELLEALQNCRELLTYLIDAIPTGKVRETVTNCNIIALSAINKAL